MTQSSCKCDMKSKSHPSMKLALVGVSRVNAPLHPVLGRFLLLWMSGITKWHSTKEWKDTEWTVPTPQNKSNQQECLQHQETFKNSTPPSKFNNFFLWTTKHIIIIQRVLNLCLLLYRTNTRWFSVYSQSPKFYSSLIAKITESSSYASFKKKLEEFFSIGINLILL